MMGLSNLETWEGYGFLDHIPDEYKLLVAESCKELVEFINIGMIHSNLFSKEMCNDLQVSLFPCMFRVYKGLNYSIKLDIKEFVNFIKNNVDRVVIDFSDYPTGIDKEAMVISLLADEFVKIKK